VAQSIVDIDAVGVDWYRCKRQSCEPQASPGERKAGVLYPGFPALEAKHAERQSQAAAVSTGSDDLCERTFDAPGDGKIAGDFAPEFKFTARVWVNRALVQAWAEAGHLFNEHERAALAWAEAVTRVSETGVPDEAFQAARAAFQEKELVDLTIAIGLMNAYNRMAISFRNTPRAAFEQ
jgi:hypothetical protein